MKPPAKMWILIDLDNGHKGSYRYLWWFETRKLALDHLKAQRANPRFAKLVGPFLYRLVKDTP